MDARAAPASIANSPRGAGTCRNSPSGIDASSTDFEPLSQWVSARIEPQTSFVARTLLIHEFRRIVLTDPDLPDSLLPETGPVTRPPN